MLNLVSRIQDKFSRIVGPRGQDRFSPPDYEGFIDQRSIHHVVGWVRNRANPSEAVTVEAILPGADGERILGKTVANAYYGLLSAASYDDVWHGFQLFFDPPLTPAGYEKLVLRPVGTQTPLKITSAEAVPFDPYADGRISPIEGYLDELTPTGLGGWVINRRDKSSRLEIEILVVLPGKTEIIARGKADQPWPSLKDAGFGADNYGFKITFRQTLTPQERDNLVVRVREDNSYLQRAPSIHGCIDAIDLNRAFGWVCDRFRPEDRLQVDALLIDERGEHLIATGIAAAFHAGIATGQPNDAEHGFNLSFSVPLTAEQLSAVTIRTRASHFILPRALPPAAPSSFQGFIDELSLDHVSGWLLDGNDPERRIAVEAVLPLASPPRILAEATADMLYPSLQSAGLGDAHCGFNLSFPTKLTPIERDSLIVRPAGSSTSLPRAPGFQGFVDSCTTNQVCGWVRDRFQPEKVLSVEASLPQTGGARLIATAAAGLHHAGLAQGAPDDAQHGFALQFDPALTPQALDAVIIRLVGEDFVLQTAAAKT